MHRVGPFTLEHGIDPEFQDTMRVIMSPFGEFKPGPIKKVDRCVSKLEHDYQDAEYPKAASLVLLRFVFWSQ